MGIQVVHDKYDFVAVRIADIHQMPDFLRPVNRSAVFPDTYMPPKGSTNTNMLQVPPRTYSESVFRVSPRRMGSGSLASPPRQMVWLFIHAYHWDSRVIWLFVVVQDILHTGYGFCVSFWRDAPVGVFVRSKFLFKRFV